MLRHEPSSARSFLVSGASAFAFGGGRPTRRAFPGETLDLVVSVNAQGTSSPASAGVVFLGALGNVLDTVTVLTAPLTTSGFQTLESSVTVPLNVAKVQIVLRGFAPTDLTRIGHGHVRRRRPLRPVGEGG